MTLAGRDRGKSLGPLRLPEEEGGGRRREGQLKGVSWSAAVFGDCSAEGSASCEIHIHKL